MNETNKSENSYNDDNYELEDLIESYKDQKINEEINGKDSCKFIDEKVSYVLVILRYRKCRCRRACWIAY